MEYNVLLFLHKKRYVPSLELGQLHCSMFVDLFAHQQPTTLLAKALYDTASCTLAISVIIPRFYSRNFTRVDREESASIAHKMYIFVFVQSKAHSFSLFLNHDFVRFFFHSQDSSAFTRSGETRSVSHLLNETWGFLRLAYSA